MLPVFFNHEVAIANHAESGRALFSFRGERRLEKILTRIQSGDYLFIQFGHNDQKDKRKGAGPFTTYKEELVNYLEIVREKNARPVLVTPVERRRWKNGQSLETLTDYAAAVRQVGKEQNVPVLDLHAMSLEFYQALGPDDSKKALVHFPANTFPGQTEALEDDTHYSNYGAHQLARCIVRGIRDKIPDLAQKLREPNETYQPSSPDSFDKVTIPTSQGYGERPEGK